MNDDLASFGYLRVLNFPARNVMEVQVLIGMDVQDAHLNLEVRRPPIRVRGPNALLTPFDFSWKSPSKGSGRPNLSQIVRPPKTFMSVPDRVALEQLESTIRHTGRKSGSSRIIRFVIPRDPGTEDNLQKFEMTLHIFGAFSSPTTCSFNLQLLEKKTPVHLQEVMSRIRSEFYVDNLLSSFDEVDEGASASKKLVELLNLGRFKLVHC
ncbi:hypothetical protein OUZ56_012727 [Daphnia magna]|uniref:Uncharacterized protein n=1 Tax=Daphnia magna TaxID=35525 RepID=A0ABQ9Z3Z0_9CRUS|nr:hypothetical protein OUZ56_012727 [Daphnia magna]